MIDMDDPGEMLPVGVAVLLVLLVLLDPRQVAMLIIGAGVVVAVLEIRDARSDPVEDLLEEPRVEPEEAVVGGRIRKIVTPQHYDDVEMSESLAARLDGEAILIISDDDTTIVDDVLERVGFTMSEVRTVLVDRETASVLHEGAVIGLRSQQVMVPLSGVWEASSDVDLDPDVLEETATESMDDAAEISFDPESTVSPEAEPETGDGGGIFSGVFSGSGFFAASADEDVETADLFPDEGRDEESVDADVDGLFGQSDDDDDGLPVVVDR